MDVAQHVANMKALLTGERPPQLSSTPAQTTSKAAGAPPALSAAQPAARACPAKTGYDVSGRLDKPRGTTKTVYLTEPTPAHLPFHNQLPISRTACRKATEVFQFTDKGFSLKDWYVWYVQEEFGPDLI